MVVWESDAYQAVVDDSDRDADRTNKDGMKVLGNGFPDKVIVNPGQYEVIGGSCQTRSTTPSSGLAKSGAPLTTNVGRRI